MLQWKVLCLELFFYVWIIILGYMTKAEIFVSHNMYIVMALDILPTYFPK